MPIPKRGEIWLADLGFVAKTRPAQMELIEVSVKKWLGFQ
jgi:hypothetical protein